MFLLVTDVIWEFAETFHKNHRALTFTTYLLSAPLDRVAEVGSRSATAIIAKQIFVCRVFDISVTNASFLRIIANLQI